MMQFMLESIRQLREDIATYSIQMVSGELVENATAYEKEFVAECLPPVQTWASTKAFLSKGLADSQTVPMIPSIAGVSGATALTSAAAAATATPLHQQILKPIAESLPPSVLYVSDTDKKIFAGVVSATVDLLRSSGRDSTTRWALYPSESLYFARPLIFEAANTVQLATLRLMLSGTVSMVLAPYRVNAQATQQFLSELDKKVTKWLGGGQATGDAGKSATTNNNDNTNDDHDDERPLDSIDDIKAAVNEQVSIFLGSRPLIGNGPSARPSPEPITPSESDVAVLDGVIAKMTDTSSPQYTLFETRVLRALAAVCLATIGHSSSGLTGGGSVGATASTAAVTLGGIAASVAASEAALRGCGALVGPSVKEVGGLVSSIIMQNWEVHRANYAAIFETLLREEGVQSD